MSKKDGYTVAGLCRLLDIKRPSYYKWLNREVTLLDLENIEIAKHIKGVVANVGRIHGYRMMSAIVSKKMAKKLNRKRIRRIMRALDLQSVLRRTKAYNYSKSLPYQVAENVLNRKFNAYRPNEKWCSDATEFKSSKTGQKVYLCAIIDLYDNSIVAHTFSSKNNNKLTVGTLKKAIESNPGDKPLIHVDRGANFTSLEYTNLVLDNNLTLSMSRVGKCIDNGPIEKFWAILKTEVVDYKKASSLEELIEKVAAHIKYYNNERPQERFKYQTPVEVRATALKALQEKSSFPNYEIKVDKRILAFKTNLNKSNHASV